MSILYSIVHGGTYVSVQSHISDVDHSGYVIDAEHCLVNAERRETLLTRNGVTQYGVVCCWVVGIYGRHSQH